MTDELIQAQVSATRVACRRMSDVHLKALQDSVDQACRVPSGFRWDRKAAAHAEIFNVLADAADDPLAAPVLSNGVGFAYDLMVAAGRAVDGMIASSRQRLLACLRAGDPEGAALEMEKHLRVLHYMWRLANCAARRT
jgi:DNA-binding FadR family transcriptional regulator